MMKINKAAVIQKIADKPKIMAENPAQSGPKTFPSNDALLVTPKAAPRLSSGRICGLC